MICKIIEFVSMQEETTKRIYKIAFFGLLAVATLFYMYIFLFLPHYNEIYRNLDTNNSGTFGDSFGALTSFFTALTFLGLLITIWQQQMAFKQQAKELKLALDESAEQTKAFIIQNQKMEEQNFDNKFFAMLDMLNTIEKRINYNNNDSESASMYIHGIINSAEENSQTMLNHYIKVIYNGVFGQYISMLLQLLKVVDKSPEEHKKHYSEIIKACTRQENLLGIMIICYALNDKLQIMELKRLIEQYSILEHINQNVSIYKGSNNYKKLTEFKIYDDLKKFYKKEAFGIKKEC